jgi:hypothetical protein
LSLGQYTIQQSLFFHTVNVAAKVKAPQRYTVQEGDATMSPKAKMPGQ